ncbi:uncharacterized protein LOC117641023 [Thrips palmi]|uniref:Uncharacterized protein LOC117641023 n=1 Tax=Thrips palmi TaxID=161013 RepID=A0A6P8YCF1_THRPL|nr:uncharacterized protein LOC117641023 [Thrips palmi]
MANRQRESAFHIYETPQECARDVSPSRMESSRECKRDPSPSLGEEAHRWGRGYRLDTGSVHDSTSETDSISSYSSLNSAGALDRSMGYDLSWPRFSPGISHEVIGERSTSDPQQIPAVERQTHQEAPKNDFWCVVCGEFQINEYILRKHMKKRHLKKKERKGTHSKQSLRQRMTSFFGRLFVHGQKNDKKKDDNERKETDISDVKAEMSEQADQHAFTEQRQKVQPSKEEVRGQAGALPVKRPGTPVVAQRRAPAQLEDARRELDELWGRGKRTPSAGSSKAGSEQTSTSKLKTQS